MPLDVVKTCPMEPVEDAPEPAAEDKPREYYELGHESSVCGKWALMKKCENGHWMIKTTVCGREWCPNCGQDHSEHHNRRISRLVPRVLCLDVVSYLIFEVRKELRPYFADTTRVYIKRNGKGLYSTKGIELLRDARRYIHRLLKREFNSARGVSRWHWYGSDMDRELEDAITAEAAFNPHLNILLEHGFIGKKQLQRIRKLWSRWQYRECGKNYYKTAPVWCHYRRETGKLWHWVEYITRPTFKHITEANKDFASSLFDFNNCSWFGKFSEADKQRGNDRYERWRAKLPENKSRLLVVAQVMDAFASDKCPVCGGMMESMGLVKTDDQEIRRDFGGGYYMVEPPVWSAQYRDEQEALHEAFLARHYGD